MRCLIRFLCLVPTAIQAATTINITTNICTPAVKHFGIDLGAINYYDSGQMMKELVFANPGFEGLIYQSIVQIGSGTATNAVENGALHAWPTGFWTGATYEFIYGTAKGRTGTVANSINPFDVSGANTNGTTYIFSDSGTAPADGDYLILRKSATGDGGTGTGAALTGWGTNTSGGATITTELTDNPPGSVGKQCVRLTATNALQYAILSANFETWPGISFIQLNGNYQLTFKAKGVGGSNRLQVTLRRGSGADWINSTLTLSNTWQTFSTNFVAAETGTAVGGISLQFSIWAGNAALLDDVSLHPTDGAATNSTPFRDAVINTLSAFQPGILRAPNWQLLGDSLDNQLAKPFARQRSGYSEYGTQQNTILLSLHEFLQVAESVNAEPWYPTPMTLSTQEIANLMEYLGGATNTPYGAVRAARGHPVPWTTVFNKIHIELGNENWNSAYRGGAIGDPVALAARADELFAVLKASPYYSAAQFDLILGEQAVVPWRVQHTHNASTNHDTIAVAPYMASQINNYATAEELYGALFAEPEWWNTANGLVFQDYTNLLYSSRPVALAVYEININAPGGAITNSQAALTAYTPSLGAGLAVADNMLMMLREVHASNQGLFALPGYEFNAGTNWAYVWGVVHDMGVTDRKRPQFLACQLANQVLAGNCLQTVHTGDDPTWTVNNINRITYTNAHYLQSYAFANATNLAVIVFNLHRTNSLAINFTGSSAPLGTITWQQLTSANITDNNENSNAVAITSQIVSNFLPAQSLLLSPYSMNVLQWHPLSARESWRLINFGTTANTGNAADLADPDGDGLANLIEYGLSSDPNVANASSVVPTATGLIFKRNVTATDMNFVVEATTDLTASNWTELATKAGPGSWLTNPNVTISETDNGTVTVNEVTNLPARFYRLRIWLP